MGDNDSNTADGNMAADSKFDAVREGTPSSSGSSPDQDGGVEPSQEPIQPQKRKGGRKPIYATSEERKQRNRQAQAAFRERRTEYIKQLEANIKQNEDALSSLQQSHRSAADEVLMLRYKNSLLERILLEKGIDVQGELDMKSGSPTLGLQYPAPMIPHIQPPYPPLQRTAMQRHQQRRSGHNFLPKLAPGQSSANMTFQGSPQGHPTPSSHASSPTSISTRSPMVMQQGGTSTPPTSAVLAQPQLQQLQGFARSSGPQHNQAYQQRQPISPNAQRPGPPYQHQSTGSIHSSRSADRRNSMNTPMSANGPNAALSASHFYPSPFQKHNEQLEQEYDSQQRSMLDQPDHEDSSDPSNDQLHGSYPPQFDHRQPPTSDFYQAPMSVPIPMSSQPSSSRTAHADTQFGNIGEMIDPDDPMLDADPFGLNASMHYPTSYQYNDPPRG